MKAVPGKDLGGGGKQSEELEGGQGGRSRQQGRDCLSEDGAPPHSVGAALPVP